MWPLCRTRRVRDTAQLRDVVGLAGEDVRALSRAYVRVAGARQAGSLGRAFSFAATLDRRVLKDQRSGIVTLSASLRSIVRRSSSRPSVRWIVTSTA